MIAPPPASAACIGPQIVISEGEVDRGTKLRVVGEGWGEECYDTGVPPDAHGALGNPLDSIVVAFVQDGKEFVVARGAAAIVLAAAAVLILRRRSADSD